MSNTYFQFKQFRIEQEHCAMKVSTDACIQGAWSPLKSETKQVLDIGTGTGLLSLMLAQRYPSISIDAIESDTTAARQAQENFSNSPWYNRIHLLQGDATIYPFDKKYDYIICNPPFFNNSLLGPKQQRNQARHTLSLSYQQIISLLKNNLTATGQASILLPFLEGTTIWTSLLEEAGVHLAQTLHIAPSSHKPFNRIVFICCLSNQEKLTSDIVSIRNSDQNYTDSFIRLLQPFYTSL